MPISTASLARAALLGGVSGLRTFTAPAVLALRGRWGASPATRVLPLLAAGELVGDKLPFVPARSSPPAYAGRVASGAACGTAVAGGAGAGVGAVAAAAVTPLSQRARAALGRRIDVPDPVLGLAEDALAVSLAWLVTAGGAPGTAGR